MSSATPIVLGDEPPGPLVADLAADVFGVASGLLVGIGLGLLLGEALLERLACSRFGRGVAEPCPATTTSTGGENPSSSGSSSPRSSAMLSPGRLRLVLVVGRCSRGRSVVDSAFSA